MWARLRNERDEGPEKLTAKQIAGLAGEFYHQLCQEFDDDPGDAIGWEEGAYVVLQDCCPDLDDVRPSKRRLQQAAEARERRFGKSADSLLVRHKLTVSPASRDALLKELVDAFALAAEYHWRRAKGDFAPDPAANRFPEFAPVQPKEKKRPIDQITLDDLFLDWKLLHLANGKAERTVADYRQKWESLASYSGTTEAEAITKATIRSWCASLMHPEPGSGQTPLSPRTVRMKYLAAVKAIYGVAVETGKIAENPAAGYAPKVAKPKRERPQGFTEDEAATILTVSRKALDNLGRMSPDNKLGVRWIPWVCAFTGARVGEVAQLRKEDFREDKGIPYIRITPEAGAVKGRRYRDVPLHPQLVDEGLLTFVRSHAPGYLFFSAKTPEDAVKKANSVAGKVSQWVRKDVKITDDRISPNHAWRHRFKTLCFLSDVPPDYAEVLMGHEDGRAARGYGDYPISALAREIRKLPVLHFEKDA